jgi:hypothetical protein
VDWEARLLAIIRELKIVGRIHIGRVGRLVFAIVRVFVADPIGFLFLYLGTVVCLAVVRWCFGWEFLSFIFVMVVAGRLVVYFLSTLTTYFGCEIFIVRLGYLRKNSMWVSVMGVGLLFVCGVVRWQIIQAHYFYVVKKGRRIVDYIFFHEKVIESVRFVHWGLLRLVLIGLLIVRVGVSKVVLIIQDRQMKLGVVKIEKL